MEGQEKLTFIVILLFFSLTLCATLISANEKISTGNETFDEDISPSDNWFLISCLFPFRLLKHIFSSISNSIRTIVTMPMVLRRLTLAECCSW